MFKQNFSHIRAPHRGREKEQKNLIDLTAPQKTKVCLMWNKSHPANMPNMMGHLSESCDRDSTPLYS